jgi:hypothetical protein
MKKIVNGMRYDTSKATLVGGYSTPGIGTSDLGYWTAWLYKTPRSGRFFLAGEGLAMTRFASRCGDMNAWGEDLIPMSREDALEWAEQYLDANTIEVHFSDDLALDAALDRYEFI